MSHSYTIRGEREREHDKENETTQNRAVVYRDFYDYYCIQAMSSFDSLFHQFNFLNRIPTYKLSHMINHIIFSC